MASTDLLQVDLPADLVRLVRAKVESGQYASESDVVEEALEALRGREEPLEAWLRDVVGPRADAIEADPSQARTVGQVRERLTALHTTNQLDSR